MGAFDRFQLRRLIVMVKQFLVGMTLMASLYRWKRRRLKLHPGCSVLTCVYLHWTILSCFVFSSSCVGSKLSAFLFMPPLIRSSRLSHESSCTKYAQKLIYS